MAKKRDEVPGLCALLKAKREAKGLTQGQVEEASGIARTNLSLYESGQKTPTLAIIYKLAEAYGVNVCELLPGGVLPETETPAEPPAGVKKKTKGKKK